MPTSSTRADSPQPTKFLSVETPEVGVQSSDSESDVSEDGSSDEEEDEGSQRPAGLRRSPGALLRRTTGDGERS